MPTLRIALAQVEPDRRRPRRQRRAWCASWTRTAADAGAHLVAFPEMMLTGYPVEDLVFRESFVAASQAALADARRRPGRRRPRRHSPSSSATSTPTARPGSAPRPRPAAGPRNALARAARRPGRRHATSSTTCPTTASSTRTATSCPATRCTVVRLGGVDVALTICEDLWQAGGPFAVAGAGAASAWS